jgi:predicted dehydrogenase
LINIGVIGCGHWGPNHVRVFSHLSDSKVVMCADTDKERLNSIKETFLNVEVTTDYTAILNSSDIHAVCIVTPTNTHFSIVKEALNAGKHVFCEKPLTLTVEESKQLGALAQSKNLILMVGHVFLFNPGVLWLKDYINSGEMGKIYYTHTTRTNLGPFRYDVNALWDLAPHDISILNFLFDNKALNVSARGHKCLGNDLEDLSFASIEYPNDIMANVHVSWLDPKKVRQITIVAEKKMVIWDDLNTEAPIKVYDKYVEKTSQYYETYGEFQLLSREGSITMPKIDMFEPLKKQNQTFLECINGTQSVGNVDASKAADVVATLVAIQESMEDGGRSVNV